MVVIRDLQAMPGAGDIDAAVRFRSPPPWRRGNCITSYHASRVQLPRQILPLTIRAAWGGVERCFLDSRTLALDDDSYLIVNENREFASSIDAERAVHSFSVLFRPGFADEVLGSALTSVDRQLEHGADAVHRPCEFAEHLRPHDHIVTPVLRYISHQVEHGYDDELWYEEQLSFLVERMLHSHRRTLAAAMQLPTVRAATRRELYRRIGLATDFIHANYTRHLTIDDLASAAHLSKFHFVRLFRAVHGTTPHAYLQAKRARAARRLIELGDHSLEAIALQTGFDNRITLFRHLRRVTGSGGSALRRLARMPMPDLRRGCARENG